MSFPEEILLLAERCVVHIQKKFNVVADYSGDTLPLLDALARTLIDEEHQERPSPPGSPVRMTMIPLFAPTLGAYFGMTLLQTFGGRWRFTNGSFTLWRIEFDSFCLRLNPAGIAANVLARQRLADFGGDLVTSQPLSDGLRDRFLAVPCISEEEFFSFATAFESVEIAREYLCLRAANDDTSKPDCSQAGYEALFLDSSTLFKT